eukprot:760291-Hanusia_phi.AAC.1
MSFQSTPRVFEYIPKLFLDNTKSSPRNLDHYQYSPRSLSAEELLRKTANMTDQGLQQYLDAQDAGEWLLVGTLDTDGIFNLDSLLLLLDVELDSQDVQADRKRRGIVKQALNVLRSKVSMLETENRGLQIVCDHSRTRIAELEHEQNFSHQTLESIRMSTSMLSEKTFSKAKDDFQAEQKRLSSIIEELNTKLRSAEHASQILESKLKKSEAENQSLQSKLSQNDVAFAAKEKKHEIEVNLLLPVALF